MMNKSKQVQDAGDNSTNLQGQQVVVNQGISYSDAKEIATDVFKANFLELKMEAATVASERAEEVTEKFLDKMNEREPGLFKEFEKPAMQDALFTVQKQFAMSGDEDLGDLLVDILVDRAAEPKRNMVQIVLDESLSIAPKLTVEQFDTLTLNFLLVQTRRLDLGTYQDFIDHYKKRVLPFIENLTDEHSYYTHIEYLGCGYNRAGNYGELQQRLRDAYKAYFSKGFTEEEFENFFDDTSKLKNLVMPCFHSVDKLQIAARDDEALEQMAKKNEVDEPTIQKLKQFFNQTTMAPNDIKKLLVEALPDMTKVFTVWDSCTFKSLELTSVGIAIAHANYRRRIGDTMDLSIWIK